jgi:epoxide hydrolase
MRSDQLAPFHIEVPQDTLDDLRERLTRTRWPEAETVTDWSQGVPRSYLRDLCRYWADGYDWRATEQRLNRLPQFRTHLDGLGIHFLHLRSPHQEALPLVLTHGWPGSVVEFLKVIGPLTDPVAHGGAAADAFHLVCPSLPGYGFSDKPTQPGWGVQRIASAWIQLMARLGYARYGAQGGDWGTSISTSIGQQDPEHVAGIHLTRRWRRRTRRPSRTSPSKSARRWPPWSTPPSGSPGTPRSTPPDPRRSATRWWTRRRRSAPGSWRSSGPGPTATVTRKTC